MKYINTFKTHSSYEEKLNGGGVDISLPNISYCEDVKDIHYNPYNTVEFYVGEITSPQTVKIYTSYLTYEEVEVNKGNKWYSYVLPKDEGLGGIIGDFVKNVTIKANISYYANYTPPFTYTKIIPTSTIEASFKGSNTSNVTDMFKMFDGCSSLTSLDLSGWDTSNVTSMRNMFYGCSSLTSLDLSGWNTSKVNHMGSMFNGCSSLTSLDLSGWNTSNVDYMNDMFYGCSSLTSLDLSGWNTSKVNHMGSMFYGCSSLTSLDLSGWNASNVRNMNDMFAGCSALKTITMKGCSEATVNKIKAVKPSTATIVTE